MNREQYAKAAAEFKEHGDLGLESSLFLLTAVNGFIDTSDALRTNLRLAFGYDVTPEDSLKAIVALREERDRLRRLLEQIRQWDHLATAGDGAYWRDAIDRALGGEATTDV